MWIYRVSSLTVKLYGTRSKWPRRRGLRSVWYNALRTSHCCMIVGVCAHGWQTMGLKCYYFSGQATVSTYSDGEAKCRALNPTAHLVTIHSKQENQWISGERTAR